MSASKVITYDGPITTEPCPQKGKDRHRNRRVGGLPSFHARLEKAARAALSYASEHDELTLLVPKLHLFALRRVLDDKPAAYDAADLEMGRDLVFSAIRQAMPLSGRAEACIEAIRALVDAEVDAALAAHGVRT